MSPAQEGAKGADGKMPKSRSSPEASTAMCEHCFDVLIDDLEARERQAGPRNREGQPTNKRPSNTSTLASQNPPAFAASLSDVNVECPLFVTWEKRPKGQPDHFSVPSLADPNTSSNQQRDIFNSDDAHHFELRGCIGTLAPKKLVPAIGEYALTSASHDRRFTPISFTEVAQLRVSVSLLVHYEACEHCFDWLVGKHGIMIRFTSAGRQFSATYLPEVAKEQRWHQKEAVTSLVRKAGYRGALEPSFFQQIQCTRYQSSKQRLSFDEYLQLKQQQFCTNDDTTSELPEAINSVIASQQNNEQFIYYGASKKRWNPCTNL